MYSKRHRTHCVGVGQAVSLTVIDPGLLAPIGVDTPRELALHGPLTTADRPEGIDENDRPSEGIAFAAGCRTEHIGDLNRQPRRIVAHMCGVPEGVCHRSQVSGVVVREAGGGA